MLMQLMPIFRLENIDGSVISYVKIFSKICRCALVDEVLGELYGS